MNKKFALPFVIAFIIISLIGCQTESVSPLSASLSELSGKVDIKQANQDGFAPANANTTLEVNGQVQTGDDGRARLDLSSGTIIRIAPSSLFTLTSNEETSGGLITKIKLEIGKIFIILNGGQADVETPSGVASVRGSYMKVEVDPITKNIYITCLEGNCSASNPAGTVNFTNGQKVILFAFDESTSTWTAPGVLPMTQEEFDEWLENNPEAKELYDQAMATITALSQPPATQTPTATPTLEQALPPTEASNACFQVVNPPAGASLPKQGQVNFEWTEQAGAEYYVITFIDANGNKATIQTTETNPSYYIEIFPNGGQYEWFVTAYRADKTEICSTGSNNFTKPKGDPTPRPTRESQPEATSTPIPCDPCDEEGSCYDTYACYGD
ncbi:MAG: FecR domain-containing protein [Anaerolineales bacterium]|nr:FecR domain-containing protein [Anaerolineales bacterium]